MHASGIRLAECDLDLCMDLVYRRVPIAVTIGALERDTRRVISSFPAISATRPSLRPGPRMRLRSTAKA